MMIGKKRGYRVLILGLALLVCALPAWSGGAQDTGAAAAGVAAGAAALESPMFAERVAAGELPPLEERLPDVPFVVRAGVMYPEDEMDYEVGTYSDRLRSTHQSPGWAPDVFLMSNEPLIQGAGIYGEDLIGNVVEAYEAGPEGDTFTFYLREGLKWSDGEVVDTDDVAFAYEDVLMNEELTPTFPTWLRTGNRADGVPVALEIIDDYTFRLSFEEPYWGFPVQLAIVGWRGYTDFIKPEHYMRRYHVDYTPLEELAPIIAEEELAEGEWNTLFHNKDHTNWENTRSTAGGFPSLAPWVLVEETPERITFERNPYYWKVDEEGKQLPYFDRVTSDLVANSESLTLKIIAGEVDYLYAGPSLVDFPMFKENEPTGGYETIILGSHTIPATIYLNHTYEDPVWREVVRDVRFRRAITHGINREEIIEAVWLGFGGSFPTMIPSEYDPELAKSLLDEIGLDQRDSDGWRLGPDGEVFEIPFELSSRTTELVPTCEIVVQHLNELGLKTTMKVVDPQLRNQRNNSNELMATMERNHFPLWWARATDNWTLGNEWGRLWKVWLDSGGRDGEEPPPEVKTLYEYTGKSMAVPPEEREAVIETYMKVLYDNVFFIPTIEDEQRPIIANVSLRNVPYGGFTLASCYLGEIFYFE
jgi:peptide/nickel transport system substrate-binding protein